MPMNTGSLKLSWYRDMDRVMLDEYARQSDEYTRIVKVSTEKKKHYVRKGLMVTLGAAQEVPEGGITPFDTFEDGPEKTVYFTSYKLGLQCTEDAFDEDNIGITKQAAKELGKSLAYTRELKAWDLLNSGFVTTARAGVDSLALFSDAHPLYGTGATTGDNLTTGALSKTTLKAALDLFENMVNEQGIPIVSKGPYLVVVGPSNRWIAEEIIKTEFDPDTANNTINSLYGKGLTFMVSHYLTDSDSWFVMDLSMKNLEFIWKRMVSTKAETDFNTDNYLWSARMRFLVTFWYWRGIVGSTGA